MVISIEDLRSVVDVFYGLLITYVMCYFNKMSYKRFIAFILLTLLTLGIRFQNEIFNFIYAVLGCIALGALVFYKPSIGKN